jgi:hypothetical protein
LQFRQKGIVLEAFICHELLKTIGLNSFKASNEIAVCGHSADPPLELRVKWEFCGIVTLILNNSMESQSKKGSRWFQ